MIKYNFKIAFRNIIRNESSSVINILGLSIGLTCSILIMLWVHDEFSYDKFHKNSNTLYRIVGDKLYVTLPNPLGPVIKEDIPEIINSARLSHYRECHLLRNKSLYKEKLCLIDNSFLEMFSFPFVEGDPNTALLSPASIVISQDLAYKIFGDKKAVGQSISILFASQKVDFTITGIFKNIPSNSHLQTQTFISFADFHKQFNINSLTEWTDWSAVTYIQIHENCNLETLKKKITDCSLKHSNNKCDLNIQQIQALKDIHLYSFFEGEYAECGDIKYVYIFSVIAFIILLIACINYINLTTSLAIGRLKEIGIKKAIGAKRTTLIEQFTVGSLLLVFIALALAILIIAILLPSFNTLTGKTLDFSLLNVPIILFVVGSALLIGILAGLSPALYLSSFRSAAIIQFKTEIPRNKFSTRRIFPILQFALSIVIIIGALMVRKQINFIQHMKLGFDKNNLMYFQIMDHSAENVELLKNELSKNPDILNLTSGDLVTNKQSTNSISWEGKGTEDPAQTYIQRVDYDFLKTFKAQMKEGRFFSEDFPSDMASAYVLNEAAVNVYGIESPVGKTLSLWNRPGKIIGIIKDYHYETAHQPVSPAILWMNTDKNFGGFESITLRINPSNIEKTIKYAQQIIQQQNYGYSPEYHFIESDFDQQYYSEKRLSLIFSISSAMAIFISCIGLFALISFVVKKRTKEIGIRKVNGASIASILGILSKDIILTISIAFVIAGPIAWYAMHKWLQNFAYKTELSWWVFAAAWAAAMAVALLTVSWQSWRAATRNPVEALRYE